MSNCLISFPDDQTLMIDGLFKCDDVFQYKYFIQVTIVAELPICWSIFPLKSSVLLTSVSTDDYWW